MSARPHHDRTELNESEGVGLDIASPIGTVSSQIRRFQALSSQIDSSLDNPSFAGRERVQSSIG